MRTPFFPPQPTFLFGRGLHVPLMQSDTMVRKLEWSKAKHFLDRALVRGCGIVFRHYYKSIAQGAGKERRDCAVVPFKSVDWSLVLHSIVLLGFARFTTSLCCDFTRVTATLLDAPLWSLVDVNILC